MVLSVPKPTRHEVEVNPREYLSFAEVKEVARLSLVFVKRLVRQVIVLELDQHEFLVTHENRAALISVVVPVEVLVVHCSQEIVHNDGGLGENTGGCLASGAVGHVT